MSSGGTSNICYRYEKQQVFNDIPMMMMIVSLCVDNHKIPFYSLKMSVFFLFFTVSDFTDSLAQLYEKHAEELQALVSNYRKKNGELRKEVRT
jgi:hypothetical protein